jgi:dihydrofolate reductase
MGKLIISSFISIDGFVAAPNDELVPPPPTPDLFHHFIEPNLACGAFLYGRITYTGMVGYWTSPAADAAMAKRLAAQRKVVFSRTLETADWGNVTISRGDDLAADVAALKLLTDKDIAILGSAQLANAFLEAGLVDGLHLLVNPMTLGAGKLLFRGGYDRQKWKLVTARPFDSGAVLLDYERARD